MKKLKDKLNNLSRHDLLIFRDTLVKYLYDISANHDTRYIISEVYRLITDLSDKME